MTKDDAMLGFGRDSERSWSRPGLKLLLLLLVVAGCSYGAYALGRNAARVESQAEIERLNAECADLMHRTYAFGSTAVPFFPGEELQPPRSYDFTNPQDRADYRQAFADPLQR